MSFRVWFLRMVWIVAAAVALSGCNGDEKENENENGTGPEGDGPSLAVTVTPADVTIGADGASGDHDVKVTITSDDDAHKTAEVELSVACTESVKAPAIGIAKKDAAAGMAEWEGQSVKLDAATVCTYTAKALEKEATGTFTVKAEEAAANTPAITLAALTENSTAGSIDVSFTHENLAAAAFMVHVACDAITAPADVTAVKNADVSGAPCSDGKPAVDGVQCTVVATDGEKCSVLVKSGDTESNLMSIDTSL